MNVITELYIEIYWFLYGSLKNTKAIKVVDILFLTLLQLANIYAFIAIAQKLMNIAATKFLLGQPTLIAAICAILFLFNTLAASNAKGKINEDDKVRYIKRRLAIYIIVSVALLLAAVFIPANS
jgi:hypothetical protein